MISRCCIIYFLLHLTDKVSLQDPRFERVVGDSVILPCISENQQTSAKVFWRLNESVNVLDIKNGRASSEDQDGRFKNQTGFPSEFSKGNYSIELRDLDWSHAGIYTCFILESDEEKTIQLFIREKTEKPTEKPEKRIEKTGKSTEGQNNSCMEREPLKMMTLLTALLGLTLHLI